MDMRSFWADHGIGRGSVLVLSGGGGLGGFTVCVALIVGGLRGDHLRVVTAMVDGTGGSAVDGPPVDGG
jgi:hypothetical protein